MATALEKEMEQAQAGTHSRMATEEKRISALKNTRMSRAEQLRQYRIDAIEALYESEKRNAEDEYARERSTVQDRLAEELVARQRRHTKVDAPELRAVTRKMRQMRGDAAATKGTAKREPKGGTQAMPLRQVARRLRRPPPHYSLPPRAPHLPRAGRRRGRLRGDGVARGSPGAAP